MQNYITKNDLLSLGIEADDKTLDDLNERVANLVGEEILTSLTPDDAEKLVAMQGKSSDEEVATWVIEHVPDYPEIIDTNTSIVLGKFIEDNELLADE